MSSISKQGYPDVVTVLTAAMLAVASQAPAFSQSNIRTTKAAGTLVHNTYTSPQVFLGNYRTNGENQSHAAISYSNAQAGSFFISQINDPKWNRDAPDATADCGPTCVAMIFLRYGLYPDGAQRNNPEGLIQSARLMMTGKMGTGGTNSSQVVRAVEAIGLGAKYLPNVSDIDAALDDGHSVMAGGCPWVPTSYGPRVGMASFQSGHWILLVRRAGDQFVACDPMCLNGPINISKGELQAFLSWHKSPCLVDIYPAATANAGRH
jgi:hypothetical protein